MDASCPAHPPATVVLAARINSPGFGVRLGGRMFRTSLAMAILWTALSQPLFGQGENPLTAVDVKSAKPKPAPRMPDGHPDLSGYWKGTRDTTPGGNIAK